MKATLETIQRNGTWVFEIPVSIVYSQAPKKGEMFNYILTSTKKPARTLPITDITQFDNCKRIETSRAVYDFMEIK